VARVSAADFLAAQRCVRLGLVRSFKRTTTDKAGFLGWSLALTVSNLVIPPLSTLGWARGDLPRESLNAQSGFSKRDCRKKDGNVVPLPVDCSVQMLLFLLSPVLPAIEPALLHVGTTVYECAVECMRSCRR